MPLHFEYNRQLALNLQQAIFTNQPINIEGDQEKLVHLAGACVHALQQMRQMQMVIDHKRSGEAAPPNERIEASAASMVIEIDAAVHAVSNFLSMERDGEFTRDFDDQVEVRCSMNHEGQPQAQFGHGWKQHIAR